MNPRMRNNSFLSPCPPLHFPPSPATAAFGAASVEGREKSSAREKLHSQCWWQQDALCPSFVSCRAAYFPARNGYFGFLTAAGGVCFNDLDTSRIARSNCGSSP